MTSRWPRHAGHVSENTLYSTYINSSYLALLLLKKKLLQWHTRIYHEETFHVNSSSNNPKYLKFDSRKVESTRNSNFGDYPGDFIL